MLAILQRVTEASVTIDGEKTAQIGRGFLILLGVARGDEEADARSLADKIAGLRVFEDENGKMNRALSDVGGSVLVVPNFTLLASCRRGNRPDFFGAEEPARAKALFEFFCGAVGERAHTERGVFGADMKVALLNDGPVTIPIESAALRAPKNPH